MVLQNNQLNDAGFSAIVNEALGQIRLQEASYNLRRLAGLQLRLNELEAELAGLLAAADHWLK